MDLTHVLDRDVGVLSGGELQRFAIGIVAVQKVGFPTAAAFMMLLRKRSIPQTYDHTLILSLQNMPWRGRGFS